MIKRTSNYLGLVVGLLALFIALGGPAWAAEKINGAAIKTGTVTTKQVKNNNLTGVDVKDGSISTPDLANGSITTEKLAGSAVVPLALALPGLRTEEGESPNVIGGFSGNSVTGGVVGATAFGGFTDFPQSVTGTFGTTAGGIGNTAAAFSFAAGRRAKAVTTGSFVWADSTNADFTSTADNQFAIRAANGMFLANDAGSAKVVPIGTRYRDNSIVAWARVSATGGLDTNFNVASVTKVGTGHYKINLASSLSSGFSLIPIVTPEVDEANGNVPPTGAANVRFAVTNQLSAGSNFDVYMYNGSFASVDNDFQLIVTGR